MEKIRVDGYNGLRFSLRRVKGGFTPGTGSPFSASLITSASESLVRVAKSGINPNKAVFTIDSKTSQILIVNNNSCQLLGYTSRELCNLQFTELLTNKNKSHVCALAEGQLNSDDGTMVLLSGKVVEMNTKTNNKVAVSLWIRQIDNDGRCLAVAEPVERRVCQLLVDKNGVIINADYESIMIFQFETTEQLIGMDISMLIPAITLPDSDNSVIAKNIRKQKATGKTGDGISFPLCLLISHNNSGSDTTTDSGLSSRNSNLFLVTVWVFQNLSGLIVIDEYGIIESCNHHFSMLMFGYAQNKILNQHISKLIPNFGQELEYLGITRSRNMTESSIDNEESETETDPVYIESNISNKGSDKDIANLVNKPIKISSDTEIQYKAIKKESIPKSLQETSTTDFCNPVASVSADIMNYDNEENKANKKCVQGYKSSILIAEGFNAENLNENDPLTPVNDSNSSLCISNNPMGQVYQSSDISAALQSQDSYENISKEFISSNRFSTPPGDEKVMTHPIEHLITSTPDIRKSSIPVTTPPKVVSYSDGKYRGDAIHSDGNVLDILYTISTQLLPCGRKVFCVWICRDPETVYDLDDDVRHQNLTLTFNSMASTIENSLGQAIKNTAAQNSSRPNSVSLMSQCEDEQISGEFSKYYTTLKQIGKGAYGYVKMAYRNSDRLLVVAKFILKEKLCPQFMILTEDKKDIPMEIYLLTTVKHPNIVTVYDVFENEKFFQLIMEKHGSGMDLFEFIDRRPMIDEKLGCFIFRQIANAVNYLHSLKILHRDIKDENIIIDQNFHVKLIDFGSATFMEEGKMFSTFFGTTEYCSPEVLAGNKYAGPELEIWSLGVTLYVLMFFENPFLDIEETLRADLIMPHKVSTNLEKLLYGMLDKDPRTRCTMRQLMIDPWINQEINPALFNFSWIVPCETYEANPEKYFTGQVYSSTTALSTTSPPDSLSLVDADSMIDGEEVDDDEEEERVSVESQEVQICDKCDKSSVQALEPISPQLLSQQMDKMNIIDSTSQISVGERKNSWTSSNMENATGKTVQIMKKIIHNQQDFTNPTKNCINICTVVANTNNNNNSNNKNHDAIEENTIKFLNTKKCTLKKNYENENLNELSLIKSKDNYIYIDFTKTTNTHLNNGKLKNSKEYLNKIFLDKSIKPNQMSSSFSETNIIDISLNLNRMMPSSKSSTDFVDTVLIVGDNNFDRKTSDQIDLNPKYINKTLLKIENNTNQLLLSKSENNIFEKKINEKFGIYDVVSLNDLNTDDPFPNCSMNDHSKTKILNQISDGGLDSRNNSSNNDKTPTNKMKVVTATDNNISC